MFCCQRTFDSARQAPKTRFILLTAEILHQLIGSWSHYLKGFMHTRWLFRTTSINSMKRLWLTTRSLLTPRGWSRCPPCRAFLPGRPFFFRPYLSWGKNLTWGYTLTGGLNKLLWKKSGWFLSKLQGVDFSDFSLWRSPKNQTPCVMKTTKSQGSIDGLVTSCTRYTLKPADSCQVLRS